MTHNVGVVGTGFGRHVLVPAFRSDPRCTVAAICAAHIEHAREAAQNLKIPNSFPDWKKLIQDPTLHIVAIAVPSPLQPAIIDEALRAGKHVFAEKPLGTNNASGQQLVSLALQRKKSVVIDFELPELQTWKKARELLKNRSLGPIRQIKVIWDAAYSAPPTSDHSWKSSAEQGGGVVNAFGSHMLYNLEWLFGPIALVRGRIETSTAPAGQPQESGVSMELAFQNGLNSTVQIRRNIENRFVHRIEALGEQGNLVLENVTPDAASGFSLIINPVGGAVTTEREPASTGDGRIPAVASLVRRFIDGIESGRFASPNLNDGIRVDDLIRQVRASHG